MNLLMQLCSIPKKKYDISDLVLKSIVRNEKIEKLKIEFDDEKNDSLIEKKKELIEIKKTKRIEEVNKKRELLLKQREEKRKAYLKRRDSILKSRKEKITKKKLKNENF